ncbi:MAG: mechanosensitive ion channel family protein [Pseudomonadota bacterium]
MRPLFGLLLLWLILPATVASAAVPLPAQRVQQVAPTVVPDDLRPGEVGDFVAPLTDADVRRLLIERLAAESDARRSGGEDAMAASLFLSLQARAERLQARTATLRDALAGAPDRLYHAYLLLTDLEGFGAMMSGLARAALVAAVGALAAVWVRRGSALRLGASAAPFVRLVLGLWAAAAFGAVAYVASFVLFEPTSAMRLLALALLGTVGLWAFLPGVVWSVFDAGRGEGGLLPLAPSAARPVGQFAIFAVGLSGTSALVVGISPLLAIPSALADVVRLAVGAALTAALAVLVWRLQGARGSVVAGGARSIEFWRGPALALVFVVAALKLVAIYAGDGRAVADADLAMVALLATALLMACVPPLPPIEDRRPGAVPARAAANVLAVAAVVLAGVLAASAAGLPLRAAFETPIGRTLAMALAWLVTATSVGLAAWAAIDRLIAAWHDREARWTEANAPSTPVDDEGVNIPVATRLQTLLPLFGATAKSVVVAVAALMALSAVGIDIGPLLAGAGILGLAIGFGAQALVQDVVAGIFFLIDDAFRVGEYIEVSDQLRGEVERLSLRSMQLRHHRGAVHTIPFGQLQAITNYNRDWVIYKQKFRLPFDTDIEQVRKLVKQVGKELLADPEHGPKFLEPLKSQGVREIDDSALIIGTKFRCRPREQFVLRRVIYHRLTQAFARHGIRLATRRVEVDGGPAPGEPAGAAVLGGQAAGC